MHLLDISPQSAQSLQLCLTLCNPMVYGPSGSSVCGIFQARILEGVTRSLGDPGWSSWPRNWTCISCIAGRFFTCWATREAHFTTVDLANYRSLCQSITLGQRTVGGGKTSQRGNLRGILLQAYLFSFPLFHTSKSSYLFSWDYLFLMAQVNKGWWSKKDDGEAV